MVKGRPSSRRRTGDWELQDSRVRVFPWKCLPYEGGSCRIWQVSKRWRESSGLVWQGFVTTKARLGLFGTGDRTRTARGWRRASRDWQHQARLQLCLLPWMILQLVIAAASM